MSNEQSTGSRAVQLAALAAKAAKIAAAASAGGPYGAVVEAAKQFLPQLIRITAVILIIAMLLPVLIFAGIPHFMFGWLGNDNADIVDFTGKAALAKNAYELFDSTLSNAVQSLISSVSTDGYESVEVETDTGNTNMVWLAAIISVRFEQDLNIISPMLIADCIADILILRVFSDNLILKIIVEDPGPEALMLKYGFTEEQKLWARVLAESMTEPQIHDGTGSYSTVDYGDITYIEGSTPVTYYHQKDIRWANGSYGITGTIGGSGCGPTALAIAVSSLTGQTVSPADVAAWSSQNGYYIEGMGSKHALIPDGAAHYGLPVRSISRNDAQGVVDALADGKLVVAIMSAGHFTSGGHFIVLRGVTADGKILVADPNSKVRSEQLWDLTLILSETNRNAVNGGPLWSVG